MGFWDTFVKVWQVRASVRIQKSFEESYQAVKEKAETNENLPKIIDELYKKNHSWNEKLKQHRKNNNK